MKKKCIFFFICTNLSKIFNQHFVLCIKFSAKLNFEIFIKAEDYNYSCKLPELNSCFIASLLVSYLFCIWQRQEESTKLLYTIEKILMVRLSFFQIYSSSSIIQFQEVSVINLLQGNKFGFKLFMTSLWCNVLVIMWGHLHQRRLITYLTD